jgi:SAM-dependent methyltransferase
MFDDTVGTPPNKRVWPFRGGNEVKLSKVVRRARRATRILAKGQIHRGYCTICERHVFFAKAGPWLRDEYLCLRCHSIPRNRALLKVLTQHFPLWREMRIHESSPCGPASDKIRRECPGLIASQFFLDVPRGEVKDGQQSEDLESLTFPDSSFDLVITQDVFEHILRPERAFAEIARTLKPGGAHVYTVPYYRGKKTLVRAQAAESGGIEYLMDPDYHANPVDGEGSLVVTEWGDEICDLIFQASGMTTSIFSFFNTNLGLEGEFLDVFVSRKVTPLPIESLRLRHAGGTL